VSVSVGHDDDDDVDDGDGDRAGRPFLGVETSFSTLPSAI